MSWMNVAKSYNDFFYTPKSLPCWQKKIFANSLAVKKKILLIANNEAMI